VPTSPSSSFLAALWLVATGGLAVVSGVRIAHRLAGDALTARVIGVLVATTQLVAVPLALTALTIVSPPAVLIGHAVATLMVLAFTRAPGLDREPGAERSVMGSAIAFATGTALAAAAAIPTVRGLDSFQSEARHYHVAMLASWLNRHTLWKLPFELPGWFTSSNPGNAEMLGLWLALPTHREQVAFLMVIPFGLLSILGTALLVDELGGRPWLGALAGIGLIGTPIAFQTQAHSLSSDLGAVSGFVCGVAFLLRARRDPSRKWVILAGVALGLAIGSKYTVVAPIAVVLVIAVFAVKPLSRLGWLLPGLVALAGPWLLRNAILTGNPLFPEPVRLGGLTIFKGGVGPETNYLTTLAHHLVRGDGVIAGRWASISWRLYGPALIVAGLGLIAVAFNRSERRREITGVGIICAAGLLLYFVTPLTGGGPNGAVHIIGSNLRYALPALILAMALAAATLPTAIAVIASGSLILYDVGKITHKIPFRPELNLPGQWLVAALLASIAAGVILTVSMRKPLRTPLVAVSVLVLALGFTTATIHRRSKLEAATTLDAVVTRHWRPGEPIAVLGVRDFRSVMGVRLDRTLVSFAAGGRVDEIPYTSAQDLDRAIARSNVRIFVVLRPDVRDAGGVPTFSIPSGWLAPADWCNVGGDRLAEVLIRPEPGESCP
jgi:4-amino-4-deoxy-L-arabinose transferase-like glycosyltransferase